jgi:hypothetical protein
MSRDLENLAKDILQESAWDKTSFDRREFEEEISDRSHDSAESACIYYHQCFEIISDYERHDAAPNESEMGGTYRADQYQEAAQAWAYEIASAVISYEAHQLLDEAEEARDDLVSTLDHLEVDYDEDDIRVGRDCPHGWAAHDREDSDGVYYWVNRQVDGLNSVAVEGGGLWFSFTWDPAKADEVEEEVEA